MSNKVVLGDIMWLNEEVLFIKRVKCPFEPNALQMIIRVMISCIEKLA